MSQTGAVELGSMPGVQSKLERSRSRRDGLAAARHAATRAPDVSEGA